MARGWQAAARRVAAVAVGALALAACAQNPGDANATLGQSIVELGDAISALREDNAAIQEQLDSLRRQVARQDTVMRQLANMAGVPVSAP
jgi:hypothetical protein